MELGIIEEAGGMEGIFTGNLGNDCYIIDYKIFFKTSVIACNGNSVHKTSENTA